MPYRNPVLQEDCATDLEVPKISVTHTSGFYNSIGWLSIVAVGVLFLGCARPLTYVELAPMTFEDELAPIDGTVELCVPRKLRNRQWNVKDHPFKVELGARAALNFEILAKSAFRKVIVSFDETCGSATRSPWLGAIILAANRDWDSIWASEQNTTITMQFELMSDDGRTLWSTTTRGQVSKKPTWLFRRRDRAAEDFGEALASALQQAFDELVHAEEVRSVFHTSTPPSPSPLKSDQPTPMS